MWIFTKKRNSNFKQEMRNILKKYMLQYITDNPSSSDVVVCIFSDAEMYIRRLTDKEINVILKSGYVSAEFGALNIVQNFAMAKIQPRSATDIMLDGFHSDNIDYAYNLYNYINKIKLQNGYISKDQYDENAELAIEIALNSSISLL